MRARTIIGDPTVAADASQVLCRNTVNFSFASKAAVTPKIQQSVLSWRSPNDDRTPAPSAQVARKINISAQHRKHQHF